MITLNNEGDSHDLDTGLLKADITKAINLSPDVVRIYNIKYDQQGRIISFNHMGRNYVVLEGYPSSQHESNMDNSLKLAVGFAGRINMRNRESSTTSSLYDAVLPFRIAIGDGLVDLVPAGLEEGFGHFDGVLIPILTSDLS